MVKWNPISYKIALKMVSLFLSRWLPTTLWSPSSSIRTYDSGNVHLWTQCSMIILCEFKQRQYHVLAHASYFFICHMRAQLPTAPSNEHGIAGYIWQKIRIIRMREKWKKRHTRDKDTWTKFKSKINVFCVLFVLLLVAKNRFPTWPLPRSNGPRSTETRRYV